MSQNRRRLFIYGTLGNISPPLPLTLSVGEQDLRLPYNVFLCLQKSAYHTGPRSFQPFFHREASWQTNRPNSLHLMYSMRPKIVSSVQNDYVLEWAEDRVDSHLSGVLSSWELIDFYVEAVLPPTRFRTGWASACLITVMSRDIMCSRHMPVAHAQSSLCQSPCQQRLQRLTLSTGVADGLLTVSPALLNYIRPAACWTYMRSAIILFAAYSAYRRIYVHFFLEIFVILQRCLIEIFSLK